MFYFSLSLSLSLSLTQIAFGDVAQADDDITDFTILQSLSLFDAFRTLLIVMSLLGSLFSGKRRINKIDSLIREIVRISMYAHNPNSDNTNVVDNKVPSGYK